MKVSFKCLICGYEEDRHFAGLQRPADAGRPPCPKCGDPKMRNVTARIAAVHAEAPEPPTAIVTGPKMEIDHTEDDAPLVFESVHKLGLRQRLLALLGRRIRVRVTMTDDCTRIEVD